MRIIAAAILPLSLMCVCHHAPAATFGTGASEFEIEFVEIGDPGNSADTTGAPNPVGSVDYIYNIGKFEVSRDMVEKASAAGGLGITLFDMKYFGGNGPNRPATGVSWNEAARFINWLNTSQEFPAAYKFSTQPGDRGYDVNANIELWVAGDPGFDAANPFRNSQAQYFLPSVNEWYKAAYYDPSAKGVEGGYWDFPTGSDAAPTPIVSGTDPGSAVSLQPFDKGPADITQAGGLSPYGAMGLGGNVTEWDEADWEDDIAVLRGVRGGFWVVNSTALSAAWDRAGAGPMNGNFNTGFRVASIPEPTSQLLGLWGGCSE